ncbi:MAG: biotin synthase BioB [Kiritimatiellae bacterium]|nr:biotin synthase BioB [Kiritimatiellia bacterium]
MQPNTETAPATDALRLADRIVAGGAPATAEELLDLLKHAPREELHEAAHRVTEALAPKRFDFCAIINARAGRCPENCKWCAQSAHYQTGMKCHGWVGTEACVKAAKDAERNGVGHIGIVTAGRAQSKEDIDALCDALRAMKRETKVHLCASLGLLSEEDLRRLKEAGLERYHCNIETAPSYFGELCTTHTPEQKMATLEAARRVGLEVCSGGIVGMGESDEQLVEFALALARVGAPSIPVNILHPIEGTPLGTRAPLPVARVLDSVSIIRLANPRAGLRFAGGRPQLPDDDARRAIYCGITAGIAGPMLTTPGPDYADDRALAAEAGFDVSQPLRG